MTPRADAESARGAEGDGPRGRTPPAVQDGTARFVRRHQAEGRVMPRPYVTAAEHRRKANRLTALVVLIIVAACAVLVITTDAGAYVHVSACKSSLRGGGGTDNDVRNAVVGSHASGFVGWASGYTRTGANSVYVRGLLTYPGGRYPLLDRALLLA
jgi:hypothetical protein